MDEYFDNEDLNGDCFLAGETGEIETYEVHRVVYFGPGAPSATVPLANTVFTGAQANTFIANNFAYSKRVNANLTDREAAFIAYLRFLAARNGLVSPTFGTAAHHVKYNEAVHFDANMQLTQPVDGQTLGAEHLAIRANLTVENKRRMRVQFTNMVCAIAYMFRVRGHHYRDDMRAKYEAIWEKCLYGNERPLINWNLIAHNALHAIMPDILDDFYTDAVANSKCAGALIKRYDSAPAGAAGVKSVYAGAQDLVMAMPGIKERQPELFAALDQAVNSMKNNRWAGSINRTFYNAGRIDFDEAKFSAVAAAIKAALEAFAPNSSLLRSNSLLRIANNAPIAGGVLARAISTAATSASNVENLLAIR